MPVRPYPVLFITNEQFFSMNDWRWVAKQVLDDGSAATLTALLDPTTIAGGIVQSFIAQASEMTMSAAAVGDRYNTQNNPLLPPIANDLALYGGTLLVRIVGDLTMGLILKRRARGAKDQEALTLAYTEALGYLEQMRQGERIFFMVPGVPEAGLTATQPMTPGPGLGPPLITNNCAIFGTIGLERNYGNGFLRPTSG